MPPQKRARARQPASAALSTDSGPEAQLDDFIDKYNPGIAALAREALALMRARLPGAVELVYDNYNALAIGFGASERLSDTIFSVALFPRWVSLFFFRGPELSDPEKRLRGKGNTVRHIVLESARILDDPAVLALMKQALELAPVPLNPASPGGLIIKSVSAKQRPRRP